MNSSGDIRMAFPAAQLFLKAEHGALTVVAIVIFITLVAVGGLAIDLGRLYGVHGQMQAYVDNIALAGAAELDGRQTSVTRALRAVIGDEDGGPLIDGSQNFAEGGTALSVSKISFLSELGTDLGPTTPTPWPGDVVLCVPWEGGAASTACSADESADAEFIEVIATERQVNYFILPIVDLIRGLFGQDPITGSANIRLRATAGFTRELCNSVPLMICNPSETGVLGGPGADFVPIPGQQILAKTGGPPSISPGNFGALAIFGNGANVFANGVATANPNTSCVSRTVSSEPGQMTGPVEDGFNVRFDLYPNGGQFSGGGTQYAPAANVTKGLTQGPSCTPNQVEASPNTMPLPRHPCFGSDVAGDPNRCADAEGRISDDGEWDRDLYWATNHGGPLPLALAGAIRYQVYQYEIGPPQQPLVGDESLAPVCNTSPPPPGVSDRRVLFVAVVNCVSETIPSGRADIPFGRIAKVFLTEPVGNQDYTPWEDNTTNEDIFIEMIGEVTVNDSSGVLHVFPVLYR